MIQIILFTLTAGFVLQRWLGHLKSAQEEIRMNFSGLPHQSKEISQVFPPVDFAESTRVFVKLNGTFHGGSK